MTPTNVVTVAATEWPVTTLEVKANAYIVDDDAEDGFIQQQLIPTATRWVENLACRSLMTQTRKQSYDFMPCSPIYLRYGPVQSVSSLTYVDTNGAAQTLASSYYEFETNRSPARFQVAYEQTWPTARHQLNSVNITYVAGYGSTSQSVPIIYRRAIIVLCKHWFDNRDALACEDGSGIVERLESILAIEGRTVEYA